MKISKKLISAIVMLTLSFVMLVTSSFAWFAMNDTVVATGMTVKAKGDQIYLQISKTTFQTTDDGKKMVDVDFTPEEDDTIYELLPVSPRAATADDKYTGTSALKWFTAVGTSNTEGGALNNEYTDKTSDAEANNGKYYLKNTFYIRLDPTAGAENSNALKVSSINVTSSKTGVFTQCLSVLVVSEINGTVKGDLWQDAGTGLAHNDDTSATLSDAQFSKDHVATISVYVFFDGDNANCTLANLALAQSATYTVDVTFTVA